MNTSNTVHMKGLIVKRRKAFPREEKLIIILQAMVDATAKGQTDFTCAEIARLIDNTPSPKLRNLLADLVAQHAIVTYREKYHGFGGFRTIYTVVKDWQEEATKPQPRKRRIKINGQQMAFDEVLA